VIGSKTISSPYAGFAFIAIICGLFIVLATKAIPHDFANYYFGATFLKEGNFTSSLYFPHVFNLEIAARGYLNVYGNFTPNTPFLALCFLPLTFFPLGVAKCIFNVLSLVLFMYSLRNLFIAYRINNRILFLIPVVFVIPLKNGFLFGQVYLLLFFLLTEGFLAYKKDRYLNMAIYWSFAIMLKVFPVLLFGFLLFKKKYKGLIYLSLICLVLMTLSVLVCGTSIWEFYFRTVLPRAADGEISLEIVQNYQSFFMLFKSIFGSNTLLFSLVMLFFKLLLLLVIYFATRHEPSELKLFSIWMILNTLLSPVGSSTYGGILLLFPFLFYMRKGNFDSKNNAIILLFFAIATVPVRYFSTLPVPFSYPRLMLYLFLFLILTRDTLKYVRWRMGSLLIFVVLMGYFLVLTEREPPRYVETLTNDLHALKYDYTVVDGLLNYIYWHREGKKVQPTRIKVISMDTTSISFRDNQYFYREKQLTFDRSNKMKPAILNDNSLIYLSDLERGIGFYQLRSIPINTE